MPLAVAELVNHVALAESGSEHPPKSGTRHEHLAYEVTVASGPSSGEHVVLGPRGITIGSGDACTLRLADPSAARMHCEISLETGTPRVVDLGSPSGVLVGGVLVREADLKCPCTIRVGETELRLLPSQNAPQTLPTRETFPDVIGVSREMRRVFSLLELAATSDDAVLLRGESGVGKDHIARALHAASRRARGPFVMLDCGALTPDLLETELLAEGSGRLTEAEGGTLYLDHVSELPIALAEKFVRALLSEVPSSSGSASVRPDVRIIASTQISLAEAINRGNFSEALGKQLVKLEIKLPTLRERPEDIVPLATHFYKRSTNGNADLPATLKDAIQNRTWPGNIRDLRHFIERSTSLQGNLKEGAIPGPGSTSPALAREVPSHLPLKDARDAWTNQFEYLYVKALLERSGWDLGVAADLAGVHRRSMQRLVANLKLKRRGNS